MSELTRTIVMTGGSGFLGRAILRRAKRENWPAKFVIYSRDEMKQWEVKQKYPETLCVLGDVARDLERMIAVFSGADMVLHLSAVKFIPEAEHNVLETIDVNINGSRNVGLAAIAGGVRTVIGISTDKACSPLNVYGMTKAVMERMYGELNRMSATNFVTVRYGNVVGSTGSVIPVFKRQIEDSGMIKVTDSRMSRFWLSVDDAIDLILWANKESVENAGKTFISMCPSMLIDDLAKAVWKMNNKKEPHITYTGIRPGEKLHEALFNEQESPRIDICKDGFIMRPATEAGNRLPEMMAYTSDHPRRWLKEQEMQQLILDAENI